MASTVYKLSEVLSLKCGKNQRSVESEGGTIPIYGTGGVMGYAKEALYERPTILFGRKGTIGDVKFIEVPFWCVDTTFYSIIDENKVDPYYLYCKLSAIDFTQFDEGTTIPSLRVETLNEIEISVPDIKYQTIVSSFIRKIDSLVSTIKKMNDNLGGVCFAS